MLANDLGINSVRHNTRVPVVFNNRTSFPDMIDALPSRSGGMELMGTCTIDEGNWKGNERDGSARRQRHQIVK